MKAADDIRGILVQFDELAEARIQGDLNFVEAHERRKKELAQEATTRIQQDDGLQSQSNENAQANLQNALTIKKLNDNRKSDLSYETGQRTQRDEILQGQVDKNSQSVVQNALNIHQEAEQRRKEIEFAHERIDNLDAENDDRSTEIRRLNTKLNKETSQRELEHARLDSELNAEIEVRTRQVETLHNLNERRKTDIQEEAAKRTDADKFIQEQVDTVAESELQSAANLANESEKRRELMSENESLRQDLTTEANTRAIEDARLDNSIQSEELDTKITTESASRVRADENLQAQIHDEAQERLNTAQGLAKQANDNATANLRNTLKILDVDTKHKELLAREESARVSEDNELQRQVDTNAEAGIQNAINIHQEANARRIADETLEAEINAERIEGDRSLQSQVDNTSSAALQNALTIHNEIEQRRQLLARLIEEKQDREHAIQNLLYEIGQLYEIPLPSLNSDLATLQNQADHNALANISNALSIQAESNRRRENVFALNKSNEKCRFEVLLERQSRFTEDSNLQEQINMLAEACIRSSLNNSQNNFITRKKLSEIEEAVDSVPKSMANNTEVTDMLNKVLG